MVLRRARIELDYNDLSLLCTHHPADVEPTIVEIGDKEYLGQISVQRENNVYSIIITINDNITRY